MSGGGSPIKLFKEPLVISVFLGMLFLFKGWETPGFLTSTINLVGQMAIPLMLLTLGVTVANLRSSGLLKLIFPSILKFVLCLICALITVRVFDLESIPAAALIIQITMPVAVSSYMLTEKYGNEPKTVAALVIVSTMMGVVYIPVTLAFLLS